MEPAVPIGTVEVEAPKVAPGDDVEFLAVELSAFNDRGTDRGLVNIGTLDVAGHLNGVRQLVRPVGPGVRVVGVVIGLVRQIIGVVGHGIGRIGIDVLVAYLGPVDAAPGSHGHAAVDGDKTVGAHGERHRSRALVAHGQAVKVQIIRLELVARQHAVSIGVQKILRLYHASEGALGGYQRSGKGAPPRSQIPLLVHDKISADIDGAFLHGQRTRFHIQGKVPADVLEHACPDHIGIEHARIDVVSHDGPVHGHGQPKGLASIIGVPQAVHVPLPQLVRLGVVPHVGDIERIRAILVPGDGDVARGGHVDDLGGVFLGLLENGMGLGKPLDLLQHRGVGLIVHAGQADLYRIPHFELGVLRVIQWDLQLGHREHPVQAMRAGDDPDLVQQLDRLCVYVQIVQIQRAQL